MCGAENNILLANTSNNDEPIDLLSRQEFIDQLIHISESLSLNKENACYAINGEWGVGKTFILEAFEKNISLHGQEGTLLSKFLLIHSEQSNKLDLLIFTEYFTSEFRTERRGEMF